MSRRQTLSAVALTALWAFPTTALAADHVEAPGAIADPAVDIADFYAWSRKEVNDTIVVAITFAGAGSSEAGPVFDSDVIYGVHIDNDADGVADHECFVRFGQDKDSGEWGVQVTGLPGGEAIASGPVDEAFDAGDGLQVFAGQREDPFFFDLQGYLDTLSSGDISFTTADFFAGLHVTAVVLELRASTVAESSEDIQIWTTTGRLN
jgi:hypothetical protein